MYRTLYLLLLIALGTPITSAASEPVSSQQVFVGGQSLLIASVDSDTLEKSLRRSIDEAITLLKQKKYQAFLLRFVAPDKIDDLRDEEGSLDTFTKDFARRKAKTLLGVLKGIRSKKPTYNEDRTEATFRVKPNKTGKDTIVWQLIDGTWYITN